MNKIKYLLALIVFLATSCEIELKNDDTELTIRSLQADRSYYFTIDSFNEGGITCGEKQSLIK
mgnify:CR=1 FL=1